MRTPFQTLDLISAMGLGLRVSNWVWRLKEVWFSSIFLRNGHAGLFRVRSEDGPAVKA